MLYIVRHGESYFNRYGVTEPDPDLTYIGRCQAAKLGEEIKDIEFDSIYCSPLRRALQTLTCAGIKNEKFKVVEILREKRESSCDFKPEESYVPESDTEVQARCKIFLESILDDLQNKKILVMTHSGFIKEFYKMLGLSPRLLGNCEMVKIYLGRS